jgi:hypothetical protein
VTSHNVLQHPAIPSLCASLLEHWFPNPTYAYRLLHRLVSVQIYLLKAPASAPLPDWYAIVKRFQIVGADTGNNTENQWTFVPRGLNRSYPMLGTEELAAIKKESFRAIFSKAFLAKFTLCVIATTSLLISILNFSDAQLKFWTHSFENQDFMRIEHAFERLTDDDARREWAELSGTVGSAGFVMSYYTAFFGGLICK